MIVDVEEQKKATLLLSERSEKIAMAMKRKLRGFAKSYQGKLEDEPQCEKREDVRLYSNFTAKLS